MQYLHLVPYVVVGPNEIPSLIVPDLALQEVPPPIQDENEDVSEWAQKGSKCFAMWMHALVVMWPNGYSVSTWSKHIPFECK
jgi:hypothetical protein